MEILPNPGAPDAEVTNLHKIYLIDRASTPKRSLHCDATTRRSDPCFPVNFVQFGQKQFEASAIAKIEENVNWHSINLHFNQWTNFHHPDWHYDGTGCGENGAFSPEQDAIVNRIGTSS